VLWKPEGGLDDLVHGLSSTMPEMANGLLVSALVLVTWEVTRPLGVKTWIRGDCQIIDTTGKKSSCLLYFQALTLCLLLCLVSLVCLCYLLRVAFLFFH
jgi:hypothetical protein